MRPTVSVVVPSYNIKLAMLRALAEEDLPRAGARALRRRTRELIRLAHHHLARGQRDEALSALAEARAAASGSPRSSN